MIKCTCGSTKFVVVDKQYTLIDTKSEEVGHKNSAPDCIFCENCSEPLEVAGLVQSIRGAIELKECGESP